MRARTLQQATMIAIFCVILLVPAMTAMADTKVELTTLNNPVTVGGILTIQCQIWNLQEGYMVNILRMVNGLPQLITSGISYMPSPVHNRVYLALRTAPDGSDIYFVTMLGVTEQDGGEYICKAYSIVHTDDIQDSTEIEIYSFPTLAYPICTSLPVSPVRIIEADILMLECSSEMTTPKVDLMWRNIMADIPLKTRHIFKDSTVYATTELEINSSHQRAVFVCTMTCTGFPDRQRSCQVGPLNVVPRFSEEAEATRRETPPTNDDDVVVNEVMVETPSGDCSKTCSPENTDLQFYLTIATFVAGLLMIIFLTTTIIMCCRYHYISTMINDGQHLSIQDTDPVYVSLQRRSNYERVYMPFEEPNITENKVVLPKEVFDEFYQSLRMKSVQS